jgi:hypothetical protein
MVRPADTADVTIVADSPLPGEVARLECLITLHSPRGDPLPVVAFRNARYRTSQTDPVARSGYRTAARVSASDNGDRVG